MSKDLAERLCADRPFRDAGDAKRRVKGWACGVGATRLYKLGRLLQVAYPVTAA